MTMGHVIQPKIYKALPKTLAAWILSLQQHFMLSNELKKERNQFIRNSFDQDFD